MLKTFSITLWSWRDSNPRPHSKTICFLHAYSGLRFSCIGKTQTTNQCLILVKFRLQPEATKRLFPTVLHRLTKDFREKSP